MRLPCRSVQPTARTSSLADADTNGPLHSWPKSQANIAKNAYQLAKRTRVSGLSRPRLALIARAKRRSEASDAGEWAALARDADEEDPRVLQEITEVCNRGIRLMLRGESMKMEPFKDDLSKYGQRFAEQGNLPGATFIYAVYQMADHQVPQQHENLKGKYLDAYTKLFNLLEDSGWRLKMEGEEEDDDDMDLLPEPSEGYFQNAGL